MRIVLLVLVLAAAAAPAAAQTLAPTQGVVDVDVLGHATLVGPITLTPDAPGDELLFRAAAPWDHVVFVAVLHPAKSGPLGAFPVAGLCVEASVALALDAPQITIADVDGDRIDDVIATRGGRAEVVRGIGLAACR
mgnify:CR=1 FL=1|jgi:hypothetical protein